MDPKTGYVKAMTDSPYGRPSSTSPPTAPGVVGSSFKVTTLATILQNGYSRNDQVDGTAPCSVPGYGGSTDNAEGGGGVMTIDQATTESVNCAFTSVHQRGARQGHRHGPSSACGRSSRGRQLVNEWRVLTFTLGVISVTPLEMANIGDDRR